ncbi:nucleosome assembly protein 1-like 1-A [Drosophila guanche]|uniref:Blast:Nucleosome assembly protein 1-like 1-A n=1 Tax=Drosophila guanche TaxID=7266 RepID=A0A3B0KTJ7_DROGU|nr:nucleosome assembly protein 1-like 1-A [Drosophila guanche]SPP89126.1 blast:Nucleosome assembly protein 1-like 1-A [Drosophila guanche]
MERDPAVVGKQQQTDNCSHTLDDGSSSDTMLWPAKSSESLGEFAGLLDAVLRPAEMSGRSRKACLQHMMDQLPGPVHNRIMALKHNQMQQIKISEHFYREVFELEKRYYLHCVELFDSRRLIVEGSVEPPPMEPSWSEEADELVEELKASKEFQQLVEFMPQMPYNAVGVPRFWLSIFRNVLLLSNMVESHDEPLLECLADLRISYEPAAYTIQFLFTPNSYLDDSSLLLTKKYFLQHQADPDYPFTFEGPEIVSCEGCHIHWRTGSNLTLQANALPRESFFNFFSPPQPLELSLVDEKTDTLLTNDFEVGFLLRTQIVPKAVLYYTGDLVDSTSEALHDSASSETSEAETKTESVSSSFSFG